MHLCYSAPIHSSNRLQLRRLFFEDIEINLSSVHLSRIFSHTHHKRERIVNVTGKLHRRLLLSIPTRCSKFQMSSFWELNSRTPFNLRTERDRGCSRNVFTIKMAYFDFILSWFFTFGKKKLFVTSSRLRQQPCSNWRHIRIQTIILVRSSWKWVTVVHPAEYRRRWSTGILPVRYSVEVSKSYQEV